MAGKRLPELQNIEPLLPNSSDRNPLTGEAYAALKTAILSGELQPRDRLYETVLARRFKMSRTPVRGALQRLVNEGLAEVGSEGLAVATLSVEDIRSLEEANRALQSLAAQLAAAKGTEAELAKLEESTARMEACVITRDLEGWIGADQEIHRQIFQMCGNRWLWKLLLQPDVPPPLRLLRDRGERGRRGEEEQVPALLRTAARQHGAHERAPRGGPVVHLPVRGDDDAAHGRASRAAPPGRTFVISSGRTSSPPP